MSQPCSIFCAACLTRIPPGADACPQCGAYVETPDADRVGLVDEVLQPFTLRSWGMLLLGLFATFVPLLGLPVAVAAIVFGTRMLKTIPPGDSPLLYTGRLRVYAGIALGALGILCSPLSFVYLIKQGYL